jgi:hypothetical protein
LNDNASTRKRVKIAKRLKSCKFWKDLVDHAMNEWIAQKIQQVNSSDQTGNKPVPWRFVQGTCH